MHPPMALLTGLEATLALGLGVGEAIGSPAVCLSGKVHPQKATTRTGFEKRLESSSLTARAPELQWEPPAQPPSSGPAWSLSGHVWRWMSWEPQDT